MVKVLEISLRRETKILLNLEFQDFYWKTFAFYDSKKNNEH